ncbi:MAG: crotonase/enoyl-CoA hydratase family protein [Paracoccaceae bacterium]|nr:crotonase/enoyl-CoA hydratase family protein [Paracoccaceae bacterium]
MNTIRLETDERGVATLTLARPDKRNAMSAEMIAELHAVADSIATDEGIRAVVLAAEGSVFCAGGDLGWMREQMAADAETRRREAAKLAWMLNALNELPKPLIGKIHGNSFGGGIGLMSVCDAVVAAKGTLFGLTETRLGLQPATIGPYVISRIGETMARRVFFSARLFSVEEAERMALVARIAEPEDLDAAVEAEVAPYLETAPGAVAEAKALTRLMGPKIDPHRIEATIDMLVARWETDEAEEGISAFFEKRKAAWMPKD